MFVHRLKSSLIMILIDILNILFSCLWKKYKQVHQVPYGSFTLPNAMHYSSGQQLMSIWLRPLPLLPYKHTPVRLYSLWIQNRIIRQSCSHFTVTYWGINFLHQNCFISWSRKYLQGGPVRIVRRLFEFSRGGGVWGIFSVILFVKD